MQDPPNQLAPEPWRELAPEGQRGWLEAYLSRTLGGILGQAAGDIAPERPLTGFGLDSLAAIELQHRIEADLAVEVDLATLLDGPTLRELAAAIAERAAAPVRGVPLGPAPPRPQGYPLTHNQRALWFLQGLEPRSAAYNIGAAAAVEPALDLATLRRALALLADRHQALRLGFAGSESGPVQRAEPGRGVELTTEDAAGWGAARLDARIAEIAYRPFDLARDPLFRLAVFRGAPGVSDVVLLVAHHVVADLWSLLVLVRDLAEIYWRLAADPAAQAGGPGDPGDPGDPDTAGAPGLAGLRFTDYAAWREERLAAGEGEADWAYWRERLAGELPDLDLAPDRQRPPAQTFHGGTRWRRLDPGLLASVRALARDAGTTLFTPLLAALAALLHRCGAGDELLVGTPTAGRGDVRLSEVVGLFVNPVVLRLRPSAELAFDQLLGQARESALAAFAHQAYPFPLLVERLRPRRDPSRSPVFQVMLSFQGSHLDEARDLAAFALGEPGARASLGGWTLVSRRLAQRTAQLDLELIAAETSQGLGLALVYNADLFDPATAERLLEGLESLLRGAVREPRRQLADLAILSAAARHQLLHDGNDTAAAHDLGPSFPAAFAAQVRRTPAALAVCCGDRALSYAELAAAAGRTAAALLGSGLAPEARVVFWAERSVEFLVAMIAVLAAGGVYLPLDPRQPARRLRQLVLASGARLVLASPRFDADARAAVADAAGGLQVLPLDGLASGPPAARRPPPLPGQLAYVLFTSGSTGIPKGAMIEHRSLLNHLLSKTVQPPLAAGDRVAQTAAATFDISIWQFLAPLLVGGSVHVLADEIAGDPSRLFAAVARQGITVLETVPSLLSALLQETDGGLAPELAALRWLVLTGEALPPELCRRWLARFPAVPLLNAYGPTECADDVSVQAIRVPPPPGSLRVPIGRPLPGLRLHVLDRALGLAPSGVAGELCVAGAGVGRGYLGDPARTAAAFVPDPYDPAGGGRLYRTGDLALRRPDGLLDYLGRLDHQVKVRGLRIELGEIEAALDEHPGIAQASVLAWRVDGETRLAAYWSAESQPAPPPATAEIREFLQQRLPDGMVPSVFVRMPAMPLTPSGKIDRRALPEPDWSGGADLLSRTAHAGIEELLALLFARVLGRDRVGADDDFFALGGHSLLATQVVARVRQELGVELPLQVLFAQPTPAGLALRVRALRELSSPEDAPPPLAPRAERATLPLSFGQERLWFLHQLEPESPVYNMPGAVRLHGRLRVAALAGSLAAIVARHESLRTVFRADAGVPSQEILDAAAFPLPLLDLTGLPAARRETHAQGVAVAESRRPFDLARWPLLRTALLRLDRDDHLLLVTLHHIVADGWSQGILVREMSTFYEALACPGAPLPAPLPAQYADFARWQRDWLAGAVLARQLDYWRQRLGDDPAPLELPLDRRRPPRRTWRGARRSVELSAATSAALRRHGRAMGVTPFMSALALFAACLGRHTGQGRIDLGSPIANRRLPELEELIGFFVNVLVLRVELAGGPSLSRLLDGVRATTLDAYAHQDVPFERLVDELVRERDVSRSPLVQALFVFQNAPAARLVLRDLDLALAELDNGTAKFELTLSLEETDGGLAGWIEYNRDLFDGVTVERLVGHLHVLMAAATADPELPLDLLPMLAEGERSQLLRAWNDSAAEEPPEPFVHRLVAAQARRTPHAVAVSAPEGSLSYGELVARSHGLARALAGAGIAADTPVGILAERSLEMVAGLLGVLEAGGCYLPLDPRYPGQRLAAMVEDSGAALVLAQEGLAGRLAGVAVRVLPLAMPALPAMLETPAMLEMPATPADVAVPLDPPLWPESLAYVLFTSGSTGRPKGVQIAHRGLAGLLASLAREPFLLGGRTLLSVTTLAFDIAGVEIFLPLTTGGRVVLAGRDALLDGARLGAALADAQATLLQATPTTWRMLADSGWQGCQGLAAITGGEALSRELAARLGARVAVLWNGYGPTEATIYSSFHRVGGETDGIPIGRPAADTVVQVLDGARQPVPIGVAGEIHLGGRGLARGYAGRPDLTAERFAPDPVGGEPGARLYLTGDLGRRLPDGRIEYLGRTDHQVKLRGFRIELQEIEAVLESHPAIEQAVVTVDERAQPGTAPAGERRLAAWLVAARAGAPEPGELRSFLRRRLPDYMVPALFIPLAALPLTPNGKIDRRALPAVGAGLAEERPYLGPRNAGEAIVADVFAAVLGRERVGIEDDFFALGGHSLLATQVVSRVNAALASGLPLHSLFETPTVAGLARSAAAARGRRPRPPFAHAPRDRPLALSFAQERLWVFSRAAPRSAVYNVFQALRITGPLAVGPLARSLVEVARRHEVLRTRFATLRGLPIQVVAAEPAVPFGCVDLAGLSPAVAAAETERLARRQARRPFRIAVEPPLRATLLLLGEDRRVLLLAMHHIACDAWSIGLFVREVAALYEAFRRGLPSPLPELRCQYADYAFWQRAWLGDEVLADGIEDWRRRLGSNPPVLALPTDRPRPAQRAFQGAVLPFALGGPLTAELRQLGRREGCTLFMVLLAALADVLARLCAQQDLVIGTPVAGRLLPEVEPLIGFFVNLLPIRIDASGEPSWGELLGRVRSAALAAYDRQEVPFEKLVEALLPPVRDASRPPLHQVALSMQDAAMEPVSLGGGAEVDPMDVDAGVARLDLTLFAWPAGDGLAGACEYDTAIFDRATVARLLEALQLALAGLAAGAERRPLAPPAAALEQAPLSRAPAPPAPPAGVIETNLTPAQLLFWFAPRLQPEVQLYFDRATTTFTMHGELDELHFERAFAKLLAGCDSLRTRVVMRGAVPMRVVGPPCPEALAHVDLSPAPDPDAAFAAWLAERAPLPIDLAVKPFDAALVRLAPARWAWFWNVHHIAMDAGSLQTIARQLSHLYELSLAGRLDDAEPLMSFDEYAAEQHSLRESPRYERARRYWERKLGLTPGANPFYRPAGAAGTTSTARRAFDLGGAASARVRELAASAGLFSPAIIFTGALFALLHRLSGERRLRVGTSFSNRSQRFRDLVGLLMNTCPLQVEVEPGETFQSLLLRVQQETVETARHQLYPVRNPVGDRSYDVYVNYQTMAYETLCGLPVRFELLSSEHSNDQLSLQVSDFTASGSYRLEMAYNRAAFDGEQAARTEGHFQNLLASLLADPAGRLADAPLLSPDERRQLALWDGAHAELPEVSVAQLFAAQVARAPEAPAASCRGERLTYRQLDHRAAAVARVLAQAGAGPEIVVALLAERGLDFLAALLAILRTGSAYLPLDPRQPSRRLAQVLAASGAPLLLASPPLRAAAEEVLGSLGGAGRPRLLSLDTAPAPAPLPPAAPASLAPDVPGLAYILFTSGSTGVPKGAMVERRGMLNHLRAKIADLGLSPADVVAQNAAQSFDVSVWQLLAALLAGGRVHVVEDDAAADAAKLLREAQREGVTVLEIVPSLLAVLLEHAARRGGGPPPLPALRWLVSTGEALAPELCRRWADLYPAVPLLNAYGPTECSDDVTHHVIATPAAVPDGTVPIGRALANVELHVVDGNLCLLPAELPGELCVGGLAVGRGYLREPARTAEAFLPDPWCGRPGARLYRTGDLVRRRRDGALEFLGRVDHQVKIRGFRIELGEIEAVLGSFPGVGKVVLLVREDHPADRRLVAYYVPEPDWGPTAPQLRGYLQSRLPEYMLPSAFVALPSLPLTPHGKIDRRALPPPEPAAPPESAEPAGPRTPLEWLIAGICADVLHLDAIGVHDNFFERGGNSLLATQVITMLQEVLPLEIELRQVFEQPSVAGLAALIDSGTSEMGERERALMTEILADLEQTMSPGPGSTGGLPH